MSQQHEAATVRKLLETSLAKPWHYRRSGVYYLRVRPQGSVASCTVSLRTTDRPTAMTTSKQLQTALRAFHLDNPDSTWPELRDHLRSIAEDLLATPTEWELLDVMGLTYSDLNDDLGRIASTAGLSVPQTKGVIMARQIMQAAERRLGGDPRQLVKLIDEIDSQEVSDSPRASSVSLSVSPPQGQPQAVHQTLTFEALAALYMAEQTGNLQPSTMRDIKSSCGVLGDALGSLDIKAHTRSDLVGLKEKLLEGRAPSTVNKLLTRLSTVLLWAVNTGHLERTYDKGLKITGKASQSKRKAFSPDQIQSIMAYANGLPAASWERWALSLGVIAGPRIEELRQLTSGDVKQVGNAWVIDINEGEGKSIKNRHSVRVVPLVDGALGFDLEAFLGFVQSKSRPGLLEPADTSKAVPMRLFTVGTGQFSAVLNGALQSAAGYEAGGNLSFHSLRHSIASLLKAHGVSAVIAQAILGHSSQSITFDLYGGGQQVGVDKMKEALGVAFGVAQ